MQCTYDSINLHVCDLWTSDCRCKVALLYWFASASLATIIITSRVCWLASAQLYRPSYNVTDDVITYNHCRNFGAKYLRNEAR